MRIFSIVGYLLLTGFLIVPPLGPAAAQQPTEAERDAIRSACRSDFMAHCASVQPGGKEALECLLQNGSKLSEPCKSAVNAVAPKAEPVTREAAPPAAPEPAAAGTPKPVAEQTQDEQVRAIRQACTLDDFMAHCSWIQPSSPEVVLCLKANAAALSPSCQTAIGSLSTAATPTSSEPARQEQPAAPPKKPEQTHADAPPSTPPTNAASTPRKPTAKQTSAIRAACRSDFVSHCSGVQPGGAKALQCLQRNAAELSRPCRVAVAAITGGETTSPPATPPENSASPAAARLAPMPALRPREALAILRICGEDMRSLCAGLPSGGGRIISCLVDNASSLSPGCYGALSAARRY
jgi:Cysteine rich repeat